MKRPLFLVTAISALCAAAPGAAQNSWRHGLDTRFDARISQLQARLDAGIRAGTIDRREAWSLRRQLNDLSRLEQRYSYGGFTAYERADLQRRIQSVRQDIRVADAGRWDRYGQRGDYGRGGPVDDWLGLRVGERATGNLGFVPYDYRMRFRDGGGVHYRSDGKTIYGIDSRTNMVIQTYPMD
jgi:hypothetical protein